MLSLTYLASTPSIATHYLTTFNTIFFISSSGFENYPINIGITSFVYSPPCSASINGIIKPIAFKKAANAFPLKVEIPSHKGIKTDSKASIP
jgi:hypothetical protein